MTLSRKLVTIAVITAAQFASWNILSRLDDADDFRMELMILTLPIGVAAFLLAAYVNRRPGGSVGERFDAQMPPALLGMLIGSLLAELPVDILPPPPSRFAFEWGSAAIGVMEKLLFSVIPLGVSTWLGSIVNRSMEGPTQVG